MVRKSAAADGGKARQSAGSRGKIVVAARREARKKRRRPKLGLGIGNVGFFGGGRSRFFAGFGLGFFGGGFGLGGLGVFFGGFFIAFASVVGDVEAASFEEESGAGADGAFDRALSPGFLEANGFWADGEGFVFHGLEDFEFAATFAAEIFVCRHGSFLGFCIANFGSEIKTFCLEETSGVGKGEQDWAFPFCRTASSFGKSGFGVWQNDFLQALSFCNASASGGGVQSIA